MDAYLTPTSFIDSDSPAVRAFARSATGGATTDREKAVRLFYAVRDAIRYDPYTLSLAPEDLKASAVLAKRVGFCVPKAILLAAAARAEGVPSRLGFADVRNHLTSARLRALMGTDIFAFHGFTELYIEGAWVKTTPTFNRSLCERLNVPPLDFDGKQHALFHAFDAAGNRHMEYVRYHGHYADLPLEKLIEAFREHYGGIAARLDELARGGDFEKEASEGIAPAPERVATAPKSDGERD
jgi:transglutaminase-like putative cysteine protease